MLHHCGVEKGGIGSKKADGVAGVCVAEVAGVKTMLDGVDVAGRCGWGRRVKTVVDGVEVAGRCGWSQLEISIAMTATWSKGKRFSCSFEGLTAEEGTWSKETGFRCGLVYRQRRQERSRQRNRV